MYKKYLLTSLILSAVVCTASAQQITFSGNNATNIVTVTPESSTGLDAIYVARSIDGITIECTSQSSMKWYRYSSLGGGYAEELTDIEHDGDVDRLHNPQGDMGYMIECANSSHIYFWLTDYAEHQLRLDAIAPDENQECGMTTINISGSGNPIYYYSINGRKYTLNQNIYITYNTLEWDSEQKRYNQVEAQYEMSSLSSEVVISPAPYCNTTFTITGDRFLEAWDEAVSVESALFVTPAVDVQTEAVQEQTETENSNMISSSSDSTLGGSAPAYISFYAYTTDAVIHNEWQFASDSEFEDITYRFNQQDLDYQFKEEGTTYVRFVGSNSDGSCQTIGETYTVNIGASELKCPNAFSPGSSEGVNDEWKVSYRSLIDFKCWIFNRYGTQIFYFDNPEDGWDGKYKGKLVAPGVYYYVIEATGADGKHYKKSGDINILRYKVQSSSSSSTE
jgi:gliding motility-associated-like protein